MRVRTRTALAAAAALAAAGPLAAQPAVKPEPRPVDVMTRHYIFRQLSAPHVVAVEVSPRGARLGTCPAKERCVVESGVSADRVGPLVDLSVETQTYRLRHAAAAPVARVLTDYLQQTGLGVGATAGPEADELVVSGTPAGLARVAALVALIDRGPAAEPAPAPRTTVHHSLTGRHGVGLVPNSDAPPFVVLSTGTAAGRPAVFETEETYRLRWATADDAARALAEHFRRERREVVAVAHVVPNEVRVSAEAAVQAEVARVVAEIDREPVAVRVDVTIVKVPAGFLQDCGLARGVEPGAGTTLTEREAGLFQAALQNAPGREVLARPRIEVRDNQTGFLQVGQDVVTGPGRPAVPVGVAARVTPRVDADGTTHLRMETEVRTVGAAGPQAGRVVPVNAQAVQTSAAVPAGGTLVVAVPTTGDDGKPAEVLYVVKPTVRP